MIGHTGAVPGTSRSRRSSEHNSGVVVVSQAEPGFTPASATWPLRSYLELGALPSAVPCARGRAQVLLREWGLSELVDITELLVSELITNAVATTARHRLDTPIRWRLSSDHTAILIEVWDADPTPPPAPSAGPPPSTNESGRGLFLVDALSTRWNWYAVPAVRGKVVWAQLD